MYSAGGQGAYEKSRSAFQRAIALDPNDSVAVANLVIIRTEAGDLEGAYDDASRLVRQRPDDPESHHSLGYTLRYAGLHEEAARECEISISLDPKNYQWRSCSLNFLVLGQYDRARRFVELDAGSDWADGTLVAILLREGRLREAQTLAEKSRSATSVFTPQMKLIDLALRHAPQAEIEPVVRTLEAFTASIHDGEPKYYIGAFLSFCGQHAAALRQLRLAVEGGSVSYPAMDRDPLWEGVRSDPEFAAIRTLAIARQKRFLAHRAAKT
jgi:hypothetical protein